MLTDLSAKIKYGALRDSGFPEEELDGKKFLSGAFGLDLENGLDVMVAQANFLEGGCLLRLGIWHCVSDAYGAYNLLESWSENCRKVQKQDGWVWAEMTTPAGLDRETLTRLWLEETAEPCSHAEIMKEEDSWRLLGLNPPMDSHESQEEEEENYVSGSELGNVSTAPHEMKTCVFYVSASSFKNLRHAASVNDVKISGNDAVSALLWRSIMAARFPETTLDDQKTKAYLDMLLDGRSHFSSKLPTSYLGNVVFFRHGVPPSSHRDSCVYKTQSDSTRAARNFEYVQ